ncbi:putative carboxymethylenebutenolidase [Pectobacterium atrosepticum SCRI1043]|uniref:Carboxymethylenebutenolidase n=1 Tax=Pectobacterium atrosepticum (strain SCRI 1043 / ATCC BAA-672) TaxID=218491 RepID=Q6DAR9_PECAS|nr:dienelactone hydrolase family protein [Pectobacterium atrosepticum]MCL6318646.1 dienelactone hydrolase family protein [Pectobacterium atrosepticum]MCL6323088.1 dienelactone hydrolase family protein [Pectobacterium atrosepticum]CAG73103.1 putative carboxymethylenebutenolidase [Pectobacterium atrosepticum SCRI1043]
MKTDEQTTFKHLPQRLSPAVEPQSFSIITTDSVGIIASETTIPSQGEQLPAYIARPANHDGPLPIVLVVQEIFGVHQHIQDVCRRLAKQGYMAIAPELYFRQGDPSQYNDIQQILTELVHKVPDTQVLSDLDHTANWAIKQGGDASKLAITGFCWGGRITWLYAAHNPQLKAAVAWYGKFTGEKTLNSPKNPVDIATELEAPVLGLYGAKDGSIPLEHVDIMRQALRAANATAEIIVYPDAGHAFHADYRPSYHEESARDGWQRMLAWFQKNGVA